MRANIAPNERELITLRFAHHCVANMDVTLFDGGCFGGI